MIVVAVASGTSADGLDAGVVELELDSRGDLALQVLQTRTAPWPPGLAEDILALLPPATTTSQALCRLDQRVGQAVAEVVSQVVGESAVRAELVVSPGQTVFHDVRDGACLGTLQLGQPAWIAERTGLPVVSDLRARDVAAGGHGAPLASTLDVLWLRSEVDARAALNLGGIANVTLVRPGGAPALAWDTGPANCLIDIAAARATAGAQRFDAGGRIARAGTIRHDLLEALLAHPHFRAEPPVSTGREVFSSEYLDATCSELDRSAPIRPADLVATATELTALSVARALSAYDLVEVVASGGGTRNPVLMERLRHHLGHTALVTSDERGLSATAKEVVLWALLGFLSWHGLPGSTAATGAAHRSVLGRITPGHEPLRLPEPSATPVRRLRILTPAGRFR